MTSDTIKAIILDLDDTIYPTRSIPREAFMPLFHSIPFTSYGYSGAVMEEIVEDLWKYPMADVARRHAFPDGLIRDYQKVAEQIHLDLDIKPFDDYPLVREQGIVMHLVTTGTAPVQNQKIDALGIRKDFRHILIDDPFHREGGKKACFSDLMKMEKMEPGDFLVIGDNPDSEINAARQLGIPSLLLDRNIPAASISARIISGFHDLTHWLHS